MVNLPPVGTDEYRKWVEQDDFVAFIRQNVNDNEIVLYSGLHRCFIYSVLMPIDVIGQDNIDDLLNWSCNPASSWGINYEYPEPNKSPKAWIEQPLNCCGSSILSKGEQIIFTRHFDGRHEDKSYFELSQRLTHAHDLHYVPERKAYCRFDKGGDIEDAICIYNFDTQSVRFGGHILTINKELLNIHLALTNSVLVRMFDSTRFDSDDFDGWDNHLERKEPLGDEQLFYRFGLNPSRASFIRGVQIVRCSEPRDTVLRRIMHGDDDEKQYATFIANDWKNGKIEECSCDPSKMANYFTKSNLPYEVSPVFFKSEVLQKYKADPDKYKLDNRSISCRNAWHLETYDINDAGQVHTYLIYLSYLPYSEQLYWKSFNESPKGAISKRAYTTDFMGQFDTSYDPLISLKNSLKKLQENNIPWWKPRSDELFGKAHYPVTDSTNEWADEIEDLDKLVVEGFNESILKEKAKSLGCQLDDRWRSIKLLEEMLISSNYERDHAKSIIAPFRELHDLRSKMKAHDSGQEAKKTAARLIGQHGSLKTHFRIIATQCDSAIMAIAESFQKIEW